jgi:hypothetical protein
MKSKMSQSLAVPQAEETLVAWAAFLYCLQSSLSYLAADSSAPVQDFAEQMQGQIRIMDVEQDSVHKRTLPYRYNA